LLAISYVNPINVLQFFLPKLYNNSGSVTTFEGEATLLMSVVANINTPESIESLTPLLMECYKHIFLKKKKKNLLVLFYINILQKIVVIKKLLR